MLCELGGVRPSVRLKDGGGTTTRRYDPIGRLLHEVQSATTKSDKITSKRGTLRCWSCSTVSGKYEDTIASHAGTKARHEDRRRAVQERQEAYLI